MKTFTNIQDANKEIKRLRRQLCCCPNNCPLSERTFVSDPFDPLQDVNISVLLNGTLIASSTGPYQTVLDYLNPILLGLAVVSYDSSNDTIKLVSSVCVAFSIVAAND